MFEIAIIAESTEGGGEKFPFGTFFTSRGDPYAFTESERMLSLLLTIRLASRQELSDDFTGDVVGNIGCYNIFSCLEI